jgi:hypothetical protein
MADFVRPDEGPRFTLPAERRDPLVTSVPSSYLGHPMLISDADVLVYTPAGRRMCSAASVKQARLLIRAYRRGA